MGRPRRDIELATVIGRRIAEARRARGWTQAVLAEAVNTETVSLSRYETGARMPSLSTLSALAVTLDVPLSNLIDDGRDLPAPGTSPEVAKLVRLLDGLDRDRLALATDLLQAVARFGPK